MGRWDVEKLSRRTRDEKNAKWLDGSEAVKLEREG
jgi:hypothetical protein